MKKIYFLLTVVLISIKGFSQSCDKIVEWDLDVDSIKKELPYNQTICFRLKSKKIPFEKIDDIFILEHKGSRDVGQSFEYYKKHPNLITRKFYALQIGSYDKDNKTLDVKLVEDPIADNNTKYPPKHILQPSKLYSIFLLTSDPKGQINKLLDSIKAYLHAIRAQNPDTQKILSEINSIHKKINQDELLRSEYFADITPTKLINAYAKFIYKIDLAIDSIKKVFNDFEKYINVDESKLADSISLFIEKSLNNIILKGGCTYQSPCDIDKCTLYKFLIALRQKDSSTIRYLISGNIKLSDIINPLFKQTPNVNTSTKLINIDSTILQLTNLKLYLNSLFVNDCKFYACCDTTKKYYNQANINKGLQNYLIYIDSIINHLQTSKNIQQELDEKLSKRLKTIREHRFTFTISQINLGNTLTYGLEPRNKLNIIPVFGYAYYGFQKSFNSFTPYTGILISFAPLNDDIPFKYLKHKNVWQRLTFLTGITLSSLKEDNKRDNLFSNGSNLISGFGYKLSHVVTFNIGAIIFKKEDSNPFVSTKKVAVTSFSSISINLKLKTLFEGLIGLIPGK